MKINPSKCKAVSLYEGPGEEPTKLYDRGSVYSGSQKLQILGNNLSV
jgi:hypothetical protein